MIVRLMSDDDKRLLYYNIMIYGYFYIVKQTLRKHLKNHECLSYGRAYKKGVGGKGGSMSLLQYKYCCDHATICYR